MFLHQLEKLVAFVALRSPQVIEGISNRIHSRHCTRFHLISGLIDAVFDIGEYATVLNVVVASIQCGDDVLRAEVDVVQEIPDLVSRGRRVACGKWGSVRGEARATNKLDGYCETKRVKNVREGSRESRDNSGGREDKDGSMERVHD
jgi:hypothetical protein